MLKILKPSLLLLVIFVIGGMLFKTLTPRGCDNITNNLFVLTGDVRRIPFAIKLLKDFSNRRLYVIGVGTPDARAFSPESLLPQIEIESRSKNTYENAIAVKKIVIEKKMLQITIITTEDHINRALKLVRHELPNTEIIHCAVPLSRMSAESRLSRWTVEYIKYIGTIFGFKSRG